MAAGSAEVAFIVLALTEFTYAIILYGKIWCNVQITEQISSWAM